MESLLPGGSGLTERETSPAARTHRCEVRVDGAVALVVSKAWAPARGGLMETANLNQEINDGEPKVEKDLVHTDRGAVAKVRPASTRRLLTTPTGRRRVCTRHSRRTRTVWGTRP